MGLDRPIDITAQQRKTLLSLLERHLPDTTAWVYGSRVKWTARPESDLDMVVFATTAQERRVSNLRDAFEESSLPFRVDLFVWDEIPEQFHERIEVEHVVLVEKEEQDGMHKWRPVKLGAIADVSWGDTSTTKASYVESGFTAYSAKGPDGFLPYADYNRVGVVLSAIGADCGRTWLAKGQWSCIKNTIRFWATDPKVDTEFLYWVTRNSSLWPKRGSAQPFISQGDARKLEISIPPFPEQRAIAHVLGTLDDKIELNRRMNETLEAMACSLFKSWFVDFDPVRARMEGRDTGLPRHIADLFPDQLVDSELGEIPEGWEVKALSYFGDIVTGKTPSTREPEYFGDEIPFLRIPDMHGKMYALETQIMLSSQGASSQPKKTLPPGSVSVSCIATPGLVVLNHRAVQTNQQINSIVPFDQSLSKYLYWSCRQLASDIKMGGVGGSVFGNMNKSTFSSLLITSADPAVMHAFGQLVSAIHEKILSNETQSMFLTYIRDTLLPKLISGAFRLRDSESVVKAVK